MNESLWGLPIALQGMAMAVDEFVFHRRREVPRWEWLGHALDTLVFLGCLACPLLLPPLAPNLRIYAGLALFSCLLITKDEFVHQRLCSGGEHWLHAVLFLLHPVVLIGTALLWAGIGAMTVPAPSPGLARAMLVGQGLLVAGFLGLQLAFGAGRKSPKGTGVAIDNTLYEQLGERWYTATDDPVGLLRAESRLRTPWVLDQLKAAFGERPLAILDVACGGGFLANPLAQAGHEVTGVDLSLASLEVAHRHDPTGRVTYLVQDARMLAFPEGRFDVVCMMDFLEHVEDRDAVLGEAARVLKHEGLLFFHTFNRTPASWLFGIKGVEWAVLNTPKHMHVHRLFLKPAELVKLCARRGLAIESMLGVQPRLFNWPFLKLLITGRVSDRFQFGFSRSLNMGYCGWARKNS
jgi:2-polyprenyl-6-hydroxyphenyl methylase/3-demethylubiquinone-9 3-methyltransferase